MGSISHSSLAGRFFGHVVDGLMWGVDELVRWWEIGRLTVKIKSLRRRRAEALGVTGEFKEGADLSASARERLMALSDEIANLVTREELLRKRCWAMTPEILFAAIVIAFIGGILLLQPRTDLALRTQTAGLPAGAVGGIARTAEYQLAGFSSVTTAAWWNGRLYIGGDGGVAGLDPATGVATAVRGLPADFFVRHILVDRDRLVIAGYGGVYALDSAGVTPVYEGAGLPVDLVNRVAPTSDGGHLLGTVGNGLLKGRNGIAVVILGTQGLTLHGFEWLDGELWIAHERGLLKGDGTAFSPVYLQVLAGRKISALAADRSTIYVGTDDGLVAGFKNGRDWVWTPLSPGEPKIIRDVKIVGDSLLVCAEEGLFRYRDGRFDKLSGDVGQRTLAVSSEFVATVGAKRVMLHAFQNVPSVSGSAMPIPAVRADGAAQIAASATPQPLLPAAPVQPVIPSVGTYVSDAPVPASTTAVVQATGASQTSSEPPASPQQPIQTPQPQAFVSAPASSDPVFGMVPLPASLRGPSASCALWDGTRVWIGTTNDGLWYFENGRWNSLKRSNGALNDDQVVALWRLDGKSYLYSWILGIMSLEGGRPTQLLKPDQVTDLVSAAGGGGQMLLLLKGGRLMRVKDGGLEPAGRIPEDFFNGARFVQISGERPLVVADQGILEQVQSGRWSVTFYPGGSGSDVKATASTMGGDGRLYVGLSNGSIFSYGDRKIAAAGSIQGRIRALTWDQGLWIAGETSIHRIPSGGGSPVVVGTPFSSRILGMQPIVANGAAVVVTMEGVRTITLPR